MDSTKKIKCHVVSHTHWDREWYLSFQEYRTRLIKVVSKAIDILENDVNFKSFMLDGQTSILEDYLEAKPEDEQRIRKLVNSGKLKIGPWFTQPDEALASPEAIIRNLLIGHMISSEIGTVMKVGYLPDTFCHIPQLPQIFRGFEIDNFVFMRGMGDEGENLKTEFLYKGPDDSEVIAVHLLTGYCNANMLGITQPWSCHLWSSPTGWKTAYMSIYDEEPEPELEAASERVFDLVKRLRPLSISGNVLLMNGCDHMPPQSKIQKIIDHINKKEPSIMMEQSDLDEYLQEIRKYTGDLRTFSGELRGARFVPTLASVYSTRMYLKRMNFQAQSELEIYAEPISSIAHILVGSFYPQKLLLSLWKLLLLNHAHDSIYGSGIDQVHKENETRFLNVIESASNIALESAVLIAKRVTKPRKDSIAEVVVFNPLNWPRVETVSVIAPLHIDNYTLSDGEKELLVHVGKADEEAFAWGDFCSLKFVACLPPLGYKVYSILRGESKACDELKAGEYYIENSKIRIEADPNRGGALRIYDKATGRSIDGLNCFVDEGDAGDEYNFSPPVEHDIKISSADLRATVETQNLETNALMRISIVMKIPSRLEGQRRSAELVEIPISTEVAIWPGSNRVDIRTEIENKAMDHRLRVLFPTDVMTEKASVDYHYQVIERDVEPKSKGEKWVEVPPTTHPQLCWVDVSDGSKGVMIANRGIPEYEVKKSPRGAVIYLTLIRAVGWLSRDDLVTRKGHAGPALPTPGAQCLRKMFFEYSLIFHEDSWLKSKAYLQGRCFAYPPLSVVISNPVEELPKEMSFIRVEPEELVVTALKKWERGDGIIIRFYNISDKKITGFIKPAFSFSGVWYTNLNEECVSHIENAKDRIELVVNPHKIITLLFKDAKFSRFKVKNFLLQS